MKVMIKMKLIVKNVNPSVNLVLMGTHVQVVNLLPQKEILIVIVPMDGFQKKGKITAKNVL